MHGTLNDQSLIYLQIARMLEDDILRGVYREEEQVPSTNELARGYNINPATAAKGINAVKQKRRDAFYDGYVKPLVKEGASLRLTGQELLDMIRRAIEEGESK